MPRANKLFGRSMIEVDADKHAVPTDYQAVKITTTFQELDERILLVSQEVSQSDGRIQIQSQMMHCNLQPAKSLFRG